MPQPAMMPCSRHRSRKISPPSDRDDRVLLRCSKVPGSEEARGTGQPRAKAVCLKVLKDAGLGEPPRRSRGNGNELEERKELIHRTANATCRR